MGLGLGLWVGPGLGLGLLNSPTRLKQEVLPNCGVACCELDFTRGLRMITDVRLLLAAPTPTGDHRPVAPTLTLALTLTLTLTP